MEERVGYIETEIRSLINDIRKRRNGIIKTYGVNPEHLEIIIPWHIFRLIDTQYSYSIPGLGIGVNTASRIVSIYGMQILSVDYTAAKRFCIVDTRSRTEFKIYDDSSPQIEIIDSTTKPAV